MGHRGRSALRRRVSMARQSRELGRSARTGRGDASTRARHEARDPLVDAELAREFVTVGTERREALAALGAPWETAAEYPSVGLRALAERIDEHGLAKCISHLRPIDNRQRVLPIDSALIDAWEECPIPGATHVSARSSAGTVIRWGSSSTRRQSRRTFLLRSSSVPTRPSPEFLWVAESIAHVERMISTAVQSKDQAAIDSQRGKRHPEVERAIQTPIRRSEVNRASTNVPSCGTCSWLGTKKQAFSSRSSPTSIVSADGRSRSPQSPRSKSKTTIYGRPGERSDAAAAAAIERLKVERLCRTKRRRDSSRTP